MKSKVLFFSYAIFSVCLLLYSFTQIDLNLTLSRFPLWSVIQRNFQQIGYFNRPLSTFLYSGLLISLFVLFIVSFKFCLEKKLSTADAWKIILLVTAVLFFSYNAFSYDLFNYIFDAKMVTQYHVNPYLYRALDFKGDPMLGFMHWTHRTYPYVPVWLLLTVPLSFLGLGYFLPTLLLFKTLIVGSYLGSVYLIQKIHKMISKESDVAPTIFFVLQPLVIIETLVSAHHDMVMMFFALLAFYYLFKKKSVIAYFLLLFSVGIKFATIFLLPVFFYVSFLQHKKQSINYQTVFFLSSLIMIPAVIVSAYRTEMQPWYFLWILPFITFLVKKRWVVLSTTFFSFGLMLTYIPFLYTGNYDPPLPLFKSGIVYTTILIAGVLGVVFFVIDKSKSNKC
jgi:hypothetical protein